MIPDTTETTILYVLSNLTILIISQNAYKHVMHVHWQSYMHLWFGLLYPIYIQSHTILFNMITFNPN